MSVLQPLQETTLELRHGCTEFEQALESLFTDIDQMRFELTGQMQAVEREREQIRFREAELGQRHQDSRGEVEVFKDELEKRDVQLAKALDDLQAARDELTRQREWEAAGADGTTSDLTGQLHTLQMSLEEMRRESRALQHEREALESELELVRSRAAELHETVAQQQREIAVQKNELSTELQQLRKLVEKQADLIADRTVNVRENVPQVVSSSTVQTQPNDPVVNSVMAQFAKLQKDVAQRRRRKA
jgi:chromosome segregation ATPase